MLDQIDLNFVRLALRQAIDADPERRLYATSAYVGVLAKVEEELATPLMGGALLDGGALAAAACGVPRSGRWPSARAAHLAESPCCLVSGTTVDLEVHHDEPFHECVLAGRPDLELDQRNLRTLTRTAGNDVHLVVGHLDDFRSSNPDLDASIARWNGRDETSLRTDPEWQAVHASRPKPWDEWTDAEQAAYRTRLDQKYPLLEP